MIEDRASVGPIDYTICGVLWDELFPVQLAMASTSNESALAPTSTSKPSSGVDSMALRAKVSSHVSYFIGITLVLIAFI